MRGRDSGHPSMPTELVTYPKPLGQCDPPIVGEVRHSKDGFRRRCRLEPSFSALQWPRAGELCCGDDLEVADAAPPYSKIEWSARSTVATDQRLWPKRSFSKATTPGRGGARLRNSAL